MSIVNVSGIDRDELLEALWNNAKPAIFFSSSGFPAPRFNLDEAKREVQGDYVDYACGRCIKANIYGVSDLISSRNYDRDWGEGAFQKVVDKLKRK